MAGSLGKLAHQSIASRRFDEALHHLDEAILIRPAYADLRVLRAQVFAALGKQEDRMFELTFALELNPRYGWAVFQHGLYLIDEGDVPGGVARLKEAISRDPRIDTAEYREALSVFQSGSTHEGRKLLADVVPQFKTDPHDIVRGADEFAHEGRWHDAAESYRLALDVAPRFADVRCKYGQILLQLDEVEQAIAEFREAVTINPKYADSYAMLGVALRRAGREDEAKEAFRAALEVEPGHLVASMELERRM